MEVEPVVEHQPSDGRVEGEAQSPDKVVNEHHPLTGAGRRHGLTLLGGLVSNVGREVARSLQVLDVLIGDARGLPLSLRFGSSLGRVWERGIFRGELSWDAGALRKAVAKG